MASPALRGNGRKNAPGKGAGRRGARRQAGPFGPPSAELGGFSWASASSGAAPRYVVRSQEPLRRAVAIRYGGQAPPLFTSPHWSRPGYAHETTRRHGQVEPAAWFSPAPGRKNSSGSTSPAEGPGCASRTITASGDPLDTLIRTSSRLHERATSPKNASSPRWCCERACFSRPGASMTPSPSHRRRAPARVGPHRVASLASVMNRRRSSGSSCVTTWIIFRRSSPG